MQIQRQIAPLEDRIASYKDMVGRRYGKLLVTEYLGKVEGMNGYRVRAVCDCGTEITKEARSLQVGRVKSCPACKAKQKQETICWSCANACDRNKCPWAGGKPRTDWEAEPTQVLRATWEAGKEAEYLESYRVISCPDYSLG